MKKIFEVIAKKIAEADEMILFPTFVVSLAIVAVTLMVLFGGKL